MRNLLRIYKNMPVPVEDTGKPLKLSSARKLVCDLLHFAKEIPTIPVQRQLDLSRVVAARGRLRNRPRWVSLFTKAYAELAMQKPELRRSFLKYPWARLWQHGCNVASIAVTRELEGEQAVMFAKIREPEKMSITEIEKTLDHYINSPIEQVQPYQLMIATSKLIRPLRRLIWWTGLNWKGIWREAIFGTFGISVYSGTGADSLHPISPLTTLMNYGPIDSKGIVNVRIVYDHRVMDGMVVADSLAILQAIFDESIVDELNRMANGSLRIAA
ncbi:hypothetical protein KIH39_00595 [Telmatocola sphagniphila]|uniref:2-oxoacid dehydrogenase acyltransferase catalytic domain-containing protein n=1 Tax=Telmatocola sphagniphila TaxID=1123043 RepID=A0A8E6ETH7_9BACT|nr:hypothetical protein [Telmatocola sphagniphila]QVL32449.1 hypothetical protein KIH39_00595 [Telmatocola sphagniphila]